MFGNYKVRYILSFFWLILFICMWGVYKVNIPVKDMEQQLLIIEESIENNDWEKASEYTVKFNDTYKEKQYLIKSNNSTEALITFEHTLGQLTTSVEHKSESALDYTGALSEMLNFVVVPFAGP